MAFVASTSSQAYEAGRPAIALEFLAPQVTSDNCMRVAENFRLSAVKHFSNLASNASKCNFSSAVPVLAAVVVRTAHACATAMRIQTASFPVFDAVSGKQCPFCNAKFNQQADLRRHATNVCPCRRPFTYKARSRTPTRLYQPGSAAGTRLSTSQYKQQSSKVESSSMGWSWCKKGDLRIHHAPNSQIKMT